MAKEKQKRESKLTPEQIAELNKNNDDGLLDELAEQMGREMWPGSREEKTKEKDV